MYNVVAEGEGSPFYFNGYYEDGQTSWLGALRADGAKKMEKQEAEHMVTKLLLETNIGKTRTLRIQKA